MATYTVTIVYEEGTTMSLTSSNGKGLSSGNRLVLTPGDQVNFTRSGNTSGTITTGSFRSDQWTNSNNISMSSSGTTAKYINSSPLIATDTITFTKSGATTRSLYIDVKTSLDSTPNQFSFVDQTGAPRGTIVESNKITLAGMDNGVSTAATFTSGEMWVNGFSRASGYLVKTGDGIILKQTSSASYNVAVSSTLSIGGISDTWSVTTALSEYGDPTNGVPIYFPVAANQTTVDVALSAVKAFFGGSLNPPNNLTAYYKNTSGGYVPDFSYNAAIASSGNISLDQFRGSAQSLYFNVRPQSKYGNGTSTATLLWTLGTSYTLGYGEGIDYACEYRSAVTFTEVNPSGSTSDVAIDMGGGAYGTYSSDNRYFRMIATKVGSGEREYVGYATIYAKSLYDSNAVVSATFDFSIILRA